MAKPKGPKGPGRGAEVVRVDQLSRAVAAAGLPFREVVGDPGGPAVVVFEAADDATAFLDRVAGPPDPWTSREAGGEMHVGGVPAGDLLYLRAVGRESGWEYGCYPEFDRRGCGSEFGRAVWAGRFRLVVGVTIPPADLAGVVARLDRLARFRSALGDRPSDPAAGAPRPAGSRARPGRTTTACGRGEERGVRRGVRTQARATS
jgi:hypothetical protein